MIRSIPVRIVLGLILIGGLLAIVYNFKTRQGSFVDLPSDGVLSPNIDQQTTEFEYTQLKRGKPVFRVSASQSTLTGDGVHQLSDIHMIRYGPDGETTDEVVGKTATYDLSTQRIELYDDITIWVAEGATIYASGVAADLKSEIIRIADLFTFERENLKGEGKNLRYRINYKELRVSAGITVVSDDPNFKGTAEARSAFYSLDNGQFEIFGNARLSSSSLDLRASKVEFGFDEQRQINSVSAFGDARMRLADTRQFEGEQIQIFFDENSESRLEIMGDANGGNYRMAKFMDRSSEMDYTLESRQIEGFLSRTDQSPGTGIQGNKTGSNGYKMRRLLASNDVSISSPGQGIEDGDADYLTAVFLESGELDYLELEGRVKLIRRNGKEGQEVDEVIRCSRLLLNMDTGQRLENAEATGNVDMEMTGKDIYRQLRASQYCRLSYNDQGVLEKITATDDCLLQSIEEQGRSTVRAPVVEAEFSGQKIQAVSASGGVDLEVSTDGATRRTQSDEFRMDYKDGEMYQATQIGNFQLKERTVNGFLELYAEKATYNTETGEVVATGEKRPLLRTRGETQRRGEFTTKAQGREGVTTEARRHEGVTTKAQRREGADQQISEQPGSRPGNPAIGQSNETTTRADRFVISGDNKRIRAEGNVESGAETVNGAVVITSDVMSVDPATGWVTYSGSAKLIQKENLIESVNLEMNPETAELQATGSVYSVMVHENEEKSRRFEIRSNSLVLDQNREKARYEGNVQLVSDELNLKAPRLDLLFDPSNPNQLQKVVASGGVVIMERGRTWRGEIAEYLLDEERVTVSQE